MKITIITITLNNLVGLKKTVNSVLGQKAIENIEYIVIDGGSVDGTVEYLRSLDSQIKWKSETDKGISDAFNKGLKEANGDFVLMLNSGDFFLHENVISEAIKDINENNVDVLSYKVRVDDNVFIPSSYDEAAIKRKCMMPHQGTFVNKRLYDEIGGYSLEYRIRMDYHFFARCLQRQYKFKYISNIIVSYEKDGVSMKKENRLDFWREGISISLLYGIPLGLKDCIKIVLLGVHKYEI